MKKVISISLLLALLAGFAWVMWTFKWWIILGCITLVVGNMGIERITGKRTALGRWIDKQDKKDK